MPEPISVVLNVLNAQSTIANAIRSAKPWASEIIVVDQHSSDQSREIAESLGAKVSTFEPTGYVEPARAYAIGLASYPWVLVLDADEMVPPSLASWLMSDAAQSTADLWRLPRQNYIWNHAMEGTGWGPDSDLQTRYFKSDQVQVDSQIHRGIQAIAGANCKDLKFDGTNALIHFNYVSVEDFLNRLNRYTTFEAQAILESKPDYSQARALRHAFHAFRRRYWKQGGWREGWQGFYLSLMMSFYSLAINAKVCERMQNGSRENVMDNYQKISEEILSGYRS